VISAAKRALSIVVPQSGDDVGYDEIGRVLGDQLQDEDAVLAEVRLREDGGGLSVTVARPIVAVGDLQMSPDVDDPTVPEGDRPQPARDADDRGGGDAGQPEPKKGVDLLVEEVDGQDALDRVSVNGAHLPDFEVAQRHARKPSNDDAVGGSDRGAAASPDPTTSRQVDQDLHAVRAVVGGQEGVEQEDLADGVGEVEQLRHDVQHQEIVAVAIAAEEAGPASQTRLKTCTTAASVVSLVLQIVVQMPDHVLDGLVAALRVQRVLDRVCRLDEVVDVDSRPLAEEPPEDARQVEEKCLDEQKDGNPLVIAEVLLDGAWLTGDRVVWQVIRIRHPTHLVCILHTTHNYSGPYKYLSNITHAKMQ